METPNDGPGTLTNVYDREYNRGPADYDIKHTFVSSFIYALPFAKDSKAGGWEVSGIFYVRSGRALTIGQTQGVLSTGTGILVPDEHGLQPGDVVTITIDPIGTLRNPVRRLAA